MAGNSRTLVKRSCLLFVALGKGDFTLTAEQLEAIKCIYDGKDVAPMGVYPLTTLPFVFRQLQAQ